MVHLMLVIAAVALTTPGAVSQDSAPAIEVGETWIKWMNNRASMTWGARVLNRGAATGPFELVAKLMDRDRNVIHEHRLLVDGLGRGQAADVESVRLLLPTGRANTIDRLSVTIGPPTEATRAPTPSNRPVPAAPQSKVVAETTDPSADAAPPFDCPEFEAVLREFNPKLEAFREEAARLGVGADLSHHRADFEKIADSIGIPQPATLQRAGDLLWSAIGSYGTLAYVWQSMNEAGIAAQLSMAREDLENAIGQLRIWGCKV